MHGDRIRSLLFVPGDNEARALKALATNADAVILDLEDSVAADAKATARATARRVLDQADRGGKAVFVRVNPVDTPLGVADVAAVTGGRPWGLMLPKCNNLADLERVGTFLDVLEVRENLEPGAVRLLSIATETAAATLNLSIAHRVAHARLWGVMWGGEDLSGSLGALSNRDAAGRYTFPYEHARAQCLYAASALGATAVDAVYTNFRDLEGLGEETRAGARDGFTAKAAIHPSQVDVINAVLSPTAEQVAWADAVVAALGDRAVAQLDGKMLDLVHRRIADRILRRARG